MTTHDSDAPVNSRTENHGSVVYDFNDTELIDVPLSDRMLDQLRRVVPNPPRQLSPATVTLREPSDPSALAACLLAQARVLLALGRHAESLATAQEALQMYQNLGEPSGQRRAALADCYHLMAKLNELSGRLEEALGLLHREAELRRRMSA